MVISEPGKELVGGGNNAKYVKECTELFLGGKSIDKLRGFEPFVNLESLWLNNNNLKKINNLDQNFRIKALYAQDNQICTLKGSLLCFKFLDTLDLSNNQLRDLDKLLKVLEKFKFLKHLNLKGNPCCEEPDYRLLVVHALPSLEVLDQHQVTGAERRKAAAQIGGDVQALTVAFMKRAPPHDPAWDAKVPERSQLEQELAKEAATVRDVQSVRRFEKENELFRHNPNPEIPRGRTLPPNAGVRKAMDTWARSTEALASSGQHTLEGTSRGGLSRPLKGSTAMFSSGASVSGTSQGGRSSPDLPPLPLHGMATRNAPWSAGSRTLQSAMSGTDLRSKSTSPLHSGQYVPKDVYAQYNLTPKRSSLQESGTHLASLYPLGMIRFEQEKYEEFVKVRTCGREGWQLSKQEVRL